MADLGNAAERLFPNVASGAIIKFTFTNADSGLQVLTFHNPAAVGGFNMIQSGGLYVTVKTTADVHILAGTLEELTQFGAITNANAPLFQAADGMQDFLLMPGWNRFRCKGDAAGGDLYIFPSGR